MFIDKGVEWIFINISFMLLKNMLGNGFFEKEISYLRILFNDWGKFEIFSVMFNYYW